MFDRLKEDIQVVFRRDPAARNLAEVLMCYPGLHALVMHRLAHLLWLRQIHLPARLIAHASRILTGVDIHPGATIGRRLFIDHGAGVVVGETATLGDDVTLYQGATLGGVSAKRGKRHPDIGDRVVIGAGAKVLGPLRVGPDSKVGANSVVIQDVPPSSTIVGVPARAGTQLPKPQVHPDYDLRHDRLPDPVSARLEELDRRLETLEEGKRRAESSGKKKRLSGP